MTRDRKARNETRPRPEVERTALDRALQGVAVVALILGLWVVLAAWSGLPESVPVHFDASGRPDGWGPRSTVVLLCILGLAMYVALTFAERAPHTYNYPVEITEENAPRQYALGIEMLVATKAWVAVLFLQILRMIVAFAAGDDPGSPMLPVLLLGAAYAAYLVAYFVRARRAA